MDCRLETSQSFYELSFRRARRLLVATAHSETGRPSNDSAHRVHTSSKAFEFNAIRTLRIPPIFAAGV